MKDEILDKLFAIQDPKFKDFSTNIVNSKKPIIGIRSDEAKKLAKELSKVNWQDNFDSGAEDYEEQIVLKGLSLAYAKTDFATFKKYYIAYSKKVCSWGSCDAVVCACKQIRKNQAELWPELLKMIESNKEFEMRVGLITMLCYYLTDEYIDKVLTVCKSIKTDYYYVNMATAWLIATAFAKQREKTLALLTEKSLPIWVQNKAIQKCRESFRVSKEDKVLLISLKS